MEDRYDLIIIGAGAAGFGCAVYSTRYNLKTLVLGRVSESQVSKTAVIQNYLGFKEISGTELLAKFKEHVLANGAVLKEEDVKRIDKDSDGFKVTADKVYSCKAVLLAMGTKRKTLGVKGEEEFRNKGITYCATCDAPLFKDKAVGVVGGSDAAVTSALLLAEYASKVYIIYRGDKLRSKPYLIDKLSKVAKVETVYNANVAEVYGKKFLQGVKLDTGQDLKIEGLFVEIGSVPAYEIAAELGILLDEAKSIKVNADQETNIKGVYAAGDVTKGANGFRQILLAAAEGAKAAKGAYFYISGKVGEPSQW